MLLRIVRYLLFPFSLLHALVIHLRAFAYNKGLFTSHTFNVPLICVGNIHLGGAGKTPMVDFLCSFLDTKKIVLIARGYKRTSQKKIHIINTSVQRAQEVGDELFMLAQKHPEMCVLAAADRGSAIRYAHVKYPFKDIYILDDAFQHRRVRPSLSILLCPYANLYTRDFLFPTGGLRDVRNASARAQILIISKCPDTLSEKERARVSTILRPRAAQNLFFTSLHYAPPVPLFPNAPAVDWEKVSQVICVQGVAHPKYLENYLQNEVQKNICARLRYRDHHVYTQRDMAHIKELYTQHKTAGALVVTTEKDAVKWVDFARELDGVSVLVIGVKHHFLFNEEGHFKNIIRHHIRDFSITPFLR